MGTRLLTLALIPIEFTAVFSMQWKKKWCHKNSIQLTEFTEWNEAYGNEIAIFSCE